MKIKLSTIPNVCKFVQLSSLMWSWSSLRSKEIHKEKKEKSTKRKGEIHKVSENKTLCPSPLLQVCAAVQSDVVKSDIKRNTQRETHKEK